MTQFQMINPKYFTNYLCQLHRSLQLNISPSIASTVQYVKELILVSHFGMFPRYFFIRNTNLVWSVSPYLSAFLFNKIVNCSRINSMLKNKLEFSFILSFFLLHLRQAMIVRNFINIFFCPLGYWSIRQIIAIL